MEEKVSTYDALQKVNDDEINVNQWVGFQECKILRNIFRSSRIKFSWDSLGYLCVRLS